jgi:hypothetical protein
MLEQCKLKTEDMEKFTRDKLYAEVLEKKRIQYRMTIRSKAAQTIEKISGNKTTNFTNSSCLLPTKKLTFFLNIEKF